jgi:hypothetical protein
MKKIMLEFKITDEGLNICGNEEGLKAFGEMLINAASQEDFFHQHLGFSLHDKVENEELLIDLSPPENAEIDNDVSILKTTFIGKKLWEKPE